MMTKSKASEKRSKEIYEDVWVHTQCRRCQAECALMARRVNGVVVKLEGDPDSPVGSRGGLCPKGLSALQVLYDPNRLKTPLRRTNPKKGIGVDPEWEEISWDEAIGDIATRLNAAREKDPARIVVQHGIVGGNQIPATYLAPMLMGLSSEKGRPTHINSAGGHCGNAGHFLGALNYGAFVIMPDLKYCKYMLLFGTNFGFGGFQQFANKQMAEAHVRGMKVVVFDPMANNAASRADEWVPLAPATDGIVALAMLNVIVNELGICDEDYLKQKSNAPYLIDDEGKYVRHKQSNKPMIWDASTSAAKPFDDPSVGDFALDGTYTVEGVSCRPSWQAMIESFKKVTPEQAEKISTVPAETIRRIATEYADAAQVGDTITIDGKTLPFRPVACMHIRSSGTHQNGMHALWAIDLLHHVVGAVNVPGGLATVTVECFGHEKTGRPNMAVAACPDGFPRTAGKWIFPQGGPWPVPEPKHPHHADLTELFPCSIDAPILNAVDRDDVWKTFGIPTEYDMVINYASNAIINGSNPDDRAGFYSRIPFIVDIDLYNNEFNEGFADMVLPAASPLEMRDWMGIQHPYHNQPPGLDEPWAFHITQAVVPPQYNRRDIGEIVVDILDKMGLRAKVNQFYNGMLGLDDSRKLTPTEKIDWDELCDKAVTQHFGDQYNWEWFKEHGKISWPKKVEEVYWRCFKQVRSQLYWEFMVDIKAKTEEITDAVGISDQMCWEGLSPVPVWYPVPAQKAEKEFDLYAFSWGDAMHVNTNTAEQPWIDEVSQMDPFTYFVLMNTDTAAKKGLAPGDRLEVETWRGLKVRGVLQVREAMRPDCVSMMGVAGHWATGLPIAKGKGVNFNSLIETRFSDLDPICASLDPLVKVKVTKTAARAEHR
ncbi:MAG: molybdopterin-dependent oxidoreductase [Desulfobacteraceae bacterium]|jgi:molybdopterin-containing oxidoreductase family molybdopterin binding subunit